MVKAMWTALPLSLHVKNFILKYYFNDRKEIYTSM